MVVGSPAIGATIVKKVILHEISLDHAALVHLAQLPENGELSGPSAVTSCSHVHVTIWVTPSPHPSPTLPANTTL